MMASNGHIYKSIWNYEISIKQLNYNVSNVFDITQVIVSDMNGLNQ